MFILKGLLIFSHCICQIASKLIDEYQRQHPMCCSKDCSGTLYTLLFCQLQPNFHLFKFILDLQIIPSKVFIPSLTVFKHNLPFATFNIPAEMFSTLSAFLLLTALTDL